MAELNPNEDHRRAFVQGWHDALRHLEGERSAYKAPGNNTWMATGYRHGLIAQTDDEDVIEQAWQWSVKEYQKVGNPEYALDVEPFWAKRR